MQHKKPHWGLLMDPNSKCYLIYWIVEAVISLQQWSERFSLAVDTFIRKSVSNLLCNSVHHFNFYKWAVFFCNAPASYLGYCLILNVKMMTKISWQLTEATCYCCFCVLVCPLNYCLHCTSNWFIVLSWHRRRKTLVIQEQTQAGSFNCYCSLFLVHTVLFLWFLDQLKGGGGPCGR